MEKLEITHQLTQFILIPNLVDTTEHANAESSNLLRSFPHPMGKPKLIFQLPIQNVNATNL